MQDCPEAIRKYRAGEDLLDPEDEYRRHRDWLKSPEGQAALDAEHTRTYAESRDASEARQERQRAKWTGVDGGA